MRMRVIVLVMLRVMLVFHHVELGRRHTRAKDASRGYFVIGHGQTAERASQLVERQTGIEEGTEQHVPRDTGETIKIENAGHRCPLTISESHLPEAAVTHV